MCARLSRTGNKTHPLSAIEVLKNKPALRALVRRDKEWQEVDAAELVPGDIIKLKIGNIVPADGRLLGEGDDLQVDQSALIGESLPVNKGGGWSSKWGTS